MTCTFFYDNVVIIYNMQDHSWKTIYTKALLTGDMLYCSPTYYVYIYIYIYNSHKNIYCLLYQLDIVTMFTKSHYVSPVTAGHKVG